ncbi:endonuclease domain-containing 1 protein-like [Brienomyrus brachyistius]|uniref:endonuclease domain-containing 1 protein-like n=1 Tax=Brienomyrus brachyistius TaxID=42636 RepID=UPI0020B283BD|nr:endonuclease domain-containing 1 protein-like [Brienomyrus brachyistius]
MCVCEGALLSLIVLFLPLTAPHVVHRFSDVLECEQFFLYKRPPEISGILVGGNVQDQNRYKVICQFFRNKYRFATLYDTIKRIPVFSAYKFIGKKEPPTTTTRDYLEPQLEELQKEMTLFLRKHCEKQATAHDYKNSKEKENLTKGHLFPKQHSSDHETQNSTMTLTNIVPQNANFNAGPWSQMEQNVTTLMNTHCNGSNGNTEAYVVTGAVPGNQTLAHRVNIPALMWTAFRCKTNDGEWMSMAHWGENANTTEKMETKTVTELERKLKESYNADMVKIFPQQCENGHLSSMEKLYYHSHMFHGDRFKERLKKRVMHHQRKRLRILHSDK